MSVSNEPITEGQAEARFVVFGGPAGFLGRTKVSMPPLVGAAGGVLAICGIEGVSRDRLTTLLWNDGTERAVRRRLSQTLYELRQAFGARLVSSRRGTQYFLNFELLWSDVFEFDAAIRSGDHIMASALFKRGLLSDLPSPPTKAFERWVITRETELHALVSRTATAAWRDAASKGAWHEARLASQSLLVLDPLSEGDLRKAMHAYGALGQISEAKGLFETFRRRKALVDPSWRPTEKTSSLIRAVNRMECSPTAVVHVGEASASPPSPLLGRSDELTQLSALLSMAPADRCQTIVLSGDKGIGKSRLAWEALKATFPEYGVLLLARCDERLERIPLSALAEALGSDDIHDCLPKIPQPWRDTIARLLNTGSSSPEIYAVSASGPSLELCTGVLQLLARLSSIHGRIVIFLDDAHAADICSLEVLAYVHNRWHDHAMTILFTINDQLLPASHPLSSFSARDTDVWLQLPALSPSDMVDLFDHVIGEAASDPGVLSQAEWEGLREVITSLSQGSPGRLLSLVRCVLPLSGQASRTPVQEALAKALVGLVKKLQRELSQLEVLTIQYCACLRREVSIPELFRGLNTPQPIVTQAVRKVVDCGLLTWRQNRLTFSHPLLCDAVYSCIDSATRALLHHRIAETLTASVGRNAFAEVAGHFVAAGEPERAAPLAFQMAATAERDGTINQAIQVLREVRDYPATKEIAIVASIRLGELLAREGQVDEAEASFRLALCHARELSDLLHELLAQLGLARVGAIRSSFVAQDTLEQISALRKHILDSGIYDPLPQVVELELRVRAKRGEHAHVRSILEGLPRLCGVVDSRTVLFLQSLSSLGSIYGNSHSSEEIAHEVLQTAEQGGDRDLALRALNWMIITGVQRGTLNLREGMALRRKAVLAAQESKDILERAKLEANLGVWYLDTNDHDSAKIALSRASNLLGKLSVPEARPNVLVNRGELALEQGLPEEALSFFERARRLCSDHASEPARQHASAGVCLALLRLGRISDAFREEESIACPRSWHPFDASLVIRAHTYLLLARGKQRQAEEILCHGASQLRGRFDLGWTRLALERLRLGALPSVELHEIREFLERKDLNHLLSRLRVCESHFAQ